MCVCGVYVLFVHLLEDDLRCLFSPHQVNHGGVQKPPAQVSLYKSHTTEEPLRRRRSGRYCQVLSSPAFGPSRETLADAASTTSEGLCRWAPVGLACTLEAGLPLRQRPRRNPWMWYSYPRVRPNRYDA